MQNKSSFTGRLDTKAFTLIELLVVVLIIGILAAVALPQYQKAVEKSKAAQAFALLKSVYQAAENYYLANGTWPQNFDDLDVDVPWTGTVKADTTWRGQARSNDDWSLQLISGGLNYAVYQGVIITRLSGKYKGGGFGMYNNHESFAVPLHILVCNEMWNGDYQISIHDLFCKKLFDGARVSAGTGGAVYTLTH